MRRFFFLSMVVVLCLLILFFSGYYSLSKLQPRTTTPGPLRWSGHGVMGSLDAARIIAATNNNRQTENLPALTINEKLTRAASAKVDDMFRQQYFEHVGPDGKEPRFWIEQAQYSFLTTGENLALGQFENDETLVEAWMHSEGHRANIMSPHFLEIGVAVKQGQFKGETVWLAVQEFGTSQTVCPSPSTTLRAQFEHEQQALATLEESLNVQTHSDLEQELRTLDTAIQRLASDGKRLIDMGNEEIQTGNDVYQETGSETQAKPHWDKGEQLHREGRALLDQAQTKTTTRQTLIEQITTSQNTYNQRIRDLQTKQTQINQTVQRLNEEIRAFNTCLELYQ